MSSLIRPLQPKSRGEEVFFHPQSLVESTSVGEGTRISAFVHVLPGAKIGRDCNILDYTFIDNDAVIGDHVTIHCGVALAGSVDLEDDVTVGPNASFAAAGSIGRTVVKHGASIGANATILRGVVIGESAEVGPGAVVTGNVPAHAIVSGSPAEIVGYTGVSAPVEKAGASAGLMSRVRGAAVINLPRFEDLRGALTVAELQSHVPFAIKRLYLVHDVPNREVRGEHAHRTLEQFLICAHGSCAVMADDGETRQEFLLDTPSRGLYLRSLVWSVQYQYSPDAALLVLASAPYDPADYIREYDEFERLVRAR